MQFIMKLFPDLIVTLYKFMRAVDAVYRIIKQDLILFAFSSGVSRAPSLELLRYISTSCFEITLQSAHMLHLPVHQNWLSYNPPCHHFSSTLYDLLSLLISLTLNAGLQISFFFFFHTLGAEKRKKNRNRKCIVACLHPLCTRLLFDFKKWRRGNWEHELTSRVRAQVLVFLIRPYRCSFVVADVTDGLVTTLRAPSPQFPTFNGRDWLSSPFLSPPRHLRVHAVLQLKLQQRRTREELVSQGIMPRKSTLSVTKLHHFLIRLFLGFFKLALSATTFAFMQMILFNF